ncbi:hypothetical protein CC86DRAFT_463835 [Ophiobolus disseminans]|uniref:Uncharacterized protein n=1 Tax=Ophiobolus disseminans TaxID=1469910 RepID=A0A6A7AD87_9PLEO|nr:hypothetical protein CC86DRAFT_463835 [Ophiobolus disseminans]
MNALRYERGHPQDAGFDTIPTVEEHQNLKTSMFYHVLPAVVQSRMPNLPSIRQSISDLRRTRSVHSKNISITEASMPGTPPPEYASGSTTPYRHTAPSFDFEDDESIASSASSTPPLIVPYETLSGISWQHARHGVVTLEQAHRQATIPSDDYIMATIIRSQYVHSVTLLLRSLPSRLTSAELMGLHDAIPKSVLELHDKAPQAAIPVQVNRNTQGAPERTLLWRITAWLVFQLFLLMQMLLPYVKLLLGHVARFENEHQVTRRVFNTGVAFGGGFSRECWRVSRAVCQMHDGALGDVVSDAVVYCAESIGGGVQQGLAEARSQQLTRRKERVAQH